MSDSDYHSMALKFSSNHFESWKIITKSTSSIKLLTGNSNTVFLLTSSLPIIPDKLIYRIFGPDHVTDKHRERKIFSHLSALNFGPKNLGSSTTERLEEYLEGFAPTPNFLFHDRRIISKVCKTFRKLHNFDMSKVLENEGNITEINVLKWINLIKSKLNLFEERGRLEEVREILSQETVDLFYSLLPRGSQLAFCHLDPSPVNVLYNPEKNKIRFIDYEFSGYSYRAMDIAVLLNECRMDYLYEQPPFYRLCEEMYPNDAVIKEYVLAYGGGKEMWVEVKRCSIAINFIWCLWSLAVYSEPSEGFDNLDYALMRFDMYKSAFKEFVENGKVEFLQKVADEIFEGIEVNAYPVDNN